MQHKAQLDAALTEDGKYEYDTYFSFIGDVVSQSDLAIANLETPVGAPPYRGYPSFSAPSSLAEAAVRNGIDILLTANNHICDRGRKGMLSTLRILDSLGVPGTGVFDSEYNEGNPLVIECKGIRIALVNFTYGTNGIKIPQGMHVNVMDSVKIKSIMFKAKMSMCDLIIALPHWGTEYRITESEEQRKWEKFLYRNGADMIIGTHPHTPQPVFIRENGQFTAFSLGNAVSNMTAPYTRTGLLLMVEIVKDRYSWKPEILEPEIIPVWCCRPGDITDNFTIVPIKDFLDKKEMFKRKSSHELMKHYYELMIKNNLDNARKKNISERD